MHRRTLENIHMFIKKPYCHSDGFDKEVMDLYDEVESLQKRVKELEHLEVANKAILEQMERMKRTPKFKLAEAIGDYIKEETLGRNDVKNIVRNQVTKHLEVDVNIDEHWEEYSGQTRPYLDGSANVNWR